METLSLQALGRKLTDQRGHRGIREVAQEIGISPATLSRVERGYLPDLETFAKICRWLSIDPGEVLGIKAIPAESSSSLQVHFRRDFSISTETAQALANLILAADRAFQDLMVR